MLVMLVRNSKNGITSFHTPGPPEVEFTLEAHGDDQMRDYAEVPTSLASNIQFRRALLKGVFEVAEAPEEVMAALVQSMSSPLFQRQMAQTQVAEAAHAAEVQASISPSSTDEIIAASCIAPGAGGRACGESTQMRKSHLSDRPPLCGLHITLPSTSFVQYETGKSDDSGKPEIGWTVAGLSAPVQQVVVTVPS